MANEFIKMSKFKYMNCNVIEIFTVRIIFENHDHARNFAEIKFIAAPLMTQN